MKIRPSVFSAPAHVIVGMPIESHGILESACKIASERFPVRYLIEIVPASESKVVYQNVYVFGCEGATAQQVGDAVTFIIEEGQREPRKDK